MLKLTSASRYAVHALVYFASQQTNQLVASHQVAQATGVPEKFLLKLLKPLVTARVLFSMKGPNGGYRLARPAAKITLLDVVEAMDGPMYGDVAFTAAGDAGMDRRLQEVFEQAAGIVRREFQKVKISDFQQHG
ncbi:MAG: Rrf2 family transcriptional regulator [Planctomycetes bacterium]|nr:Rrf2 family transcriptional regulator [Planctomycetota bacterium]